MAAMHWEARRRQAMLDRRLARDKQLAAEKLTTADSSQDQRGSAAPPAGGSPCPHCQSKQQSTAVLGGARVPNRYSSLDYKQQW